MIPVAAVTKAISTETQAISDPIGVWVVGIIITVLWGLTFYLVTKNDKHQDRKIDENKKIIAQNREEINILKRDIDNIYEDIKIIKSQNMQIEPIKYNLKALCQKFDIEWIE
jgi:hypothetical protein